MLVVGDSEERMRELDVESDTDSNSLDPSHFQISARRIVRTMVYLKVLDLWTILLEIIFPRPNFRIIQKIGFDEKSDILFDSDIRSAYARFAKKLVILAIRKSILVKLILS